MGILEKILILKREEVCGEEHMGYGHRGRSRGAMAKLFLQVLIFIYGGFIFIDNVPGVVRMTKLINTLFLNVTLLDRCGHCGE
ncbi:UNVERIFIED_CONTAM: hypothetical protein Slati_0820600 [Sesamum latifolium]|uniref:Uncharacterized protein n=1 Tax=Sesamum latifolium TaxID=2727402 RepID=A0AAW2XNR0_9LAMI